MTGIACSQADPFAPDFLTNPYPAYEALRALGPVFKLERYDVWAMAGYAGVEAALKDWKTFISGEGVGLNGMNPALPRPLTLQIDPPDHDKGRRVLGRTLSPGVARRLRETFQQEAEKKVSELIDKGTFDAVTDLAEAYPMKVFPDAIGIRPDGREKLLAGAPSCSTALAPRTTCWRHREGRSRGAELDHGMLRARRVTARRARHDDLPGGRRRRDQRARSNPSGAAVSHCRDRHHRQRHRQHPLALATHPDQYRRLHHKPELARNAFEEGLRYELPVQTFFRTTSRDVEIGGDLIPAHRKVLLFMASANRDPARWDNPDRFEVERGATGHVGFGAGIHACVGQMIARLEGELIFGELARRVKTIELTAEPGASSTIPCAGWRACRSA